MLYNIGIRAYGLGVITAGLLGNQKAVKWAEGRRKWQEKLREKSWHAPLWIHASSLGEFEQAKPLIEKIKKEIDKEVVVTFFSPSGYEYCKNYELADGVYYLPLDTGKNAREFISIVNPSLAVFVKYDFWFNFLKTLQQNGIPTLFFSSNFRKGQIYFKKTAAWQRSIMRKIDFIFCLNEASRDVLKEFDFKNIGICGDTRFDRVAQNAERVVEFPIIEKFKGDERLLILGSSWPLEEDILAKYIQTSFPDNLKVIIAPHDISEEHLVDIESKFERGLKRLSSVDKETVQNHKIILIDNIGMLANCYYYSDYAFVGGGFNNSLHNILEAASMSNVLLYGANISKYPEGQGLNDFGGSFALKESVEFSQRMKELLNSEELTTAMQEKSKNFVDQHKGASDKVFAKVKELLSQP